MIVGKRKIKDGSKFNHLFPRASGKDIMVKKSAKLSDTIQLIKKVVRENAWQVKKLAQFLKAESITKTCQNIWEFAYHHFQYQIDRRGIEQIRTPARSWRDRKSGIDCDCFSTLIGALLYRLKIPFLFRLTKYASYQFEHIYPVALVGNKEVIIDGVIDTFNAEVPYKEKKDIIMELHTLNGITARSILDEIDNEKNYSDLPVDATAFFDEELDGLEGRKEREARRARRREKRAEKKKQGTFKERLKTKVAKVKNGFNKINPAAALLRAGLLAAMKLNVFKVASKLRFTYWTAEEAQRNNMDLNKFNQLQRIREKIDSIFYKAGGKPINLRKAILSGKGNRNRMVQLGGLGAIITMPSDEEDLRTILGDLYDDELTQDELNGLGAAVATGTAITAASGVLATISRLIKKLGGLFKRGSKQEQQDQIQENTDNEEEKHRKFSIRNLFSRLKEKRQERKQQRQQAEQQGEAIESDPITEFLPEKIDNVSLEQAEQDEGLPTRMPEQNQQSESSQTTDETTDSTTTDTDTSTDKDKGEPGFWAKNWKWLVPVASTVVIGGVATAIYMSKKKKARAKAANNESPINGLGAAKKTTGKTKKTSAKTTNSRTLGKKRSTKKRKPRPRKKVVELIP